MFLCLLLLTVSDLPLYAQQPDICPEPRTKTDIFEDVMQGRAQILSDIYEPATRWLSNVEKSVLCANEPIPRDTLARLAMYQAFAFWLQSDDKAATDAITRALTLFPGLEWDSELAQVMSLRRRIGEFKRIRLEVTHNRALGIFYIKKGDLDGIAYVDGEPYTVDSEARHEAPPGRHLVQFRTENTVWNNFWIELIREHPRSLAPTVPIYARKSVTAVALDGIWMPGLGLELTQTGVGVRMSYQVRRKTLYRALWVAIYPGRIPGSRDDLIELTEQLGVDLIAQYSEQVSPALMRAGGTIGALWKAGPLAMIGLGATPGLLNVPGVTAFFPTGSSDETTSSLKRFTAEKASGTKSYLEPAPWQGLYLVNSQGLSGTVRASVQVEDSGLAITLAVEAGYAWLKTRAADDFAQYNFSFTTPLVGGSLLIGYRF